MKQRMNNTNRKIQSQVWVKIGMAVLLIAGGVWLYRLNPALYSQLGYLMISGDIAAIADILHSYGLWAVALSMVIGILINVLGVMPSIFISTANGLVFGIVPGIMISWLSESIGVIISFWLMRNFFRKAAKRLIARKSYLQKLDEFSGRNGFKVVLLARSLPYLPSGIITALGAVSSIRFRDYALASVLGKFPAAVLEVMVGHDLVNYEENLVRLLLVLGLAVLIYCGILWWQKRPDRLDGNE